MGEKYDGVRFCWHPIHRKAYLPSPLPLSFFLKKTSEEKDLIFCRFSRTGRVISVPANIVKLLPASFIDGEFWYVAIYFKPIHFFFF